MVQKLVYIPGLSCSFRARSFLTYLTTLPSVFSLWLIKSNSDIFLLRSHESSCEALRSVQLSVCDDTNEYFTGKLWCFCCVLSWLNPGQDICLQVVPESDFFVDNLWHDSELSLISRSGLVVKLAKRSFMDFKKLPFKIKNNNNIYSIKCTGIVLTVYSAQQ